MNTFFDVLAFHCWDTPVVFPVSAGLSLEDHRVSKEWFSLSSSILVLRFSIKRQLKKCVTSHRVAIRLLLNLLR